jgi:hypothetical protein
MGHEGLKPGWARVNFNYFYSDEMVKFIVEAIKWIATHGWKLLPLYSFNIQSGLWTYVGLKQLSVFEKKEEAGAQQETQIHVHLASQEEKQAGQGKDIPSPHAEHAKTEGPDDNPQWLGFNFSSEPTSLLKRKESFHPMSFLKLPLGENSEEKNKPTISLSEIPSQFSREEMVGDDLPDETVFKNYLQEVGLSLSIHFDHHARD